MLILVPVSFEVFRNEYPLFSSLNSSAYSSFIVSSLLLYPAFRPAEVASKVLPEAQTMPEEPEPFLQEPKPLENFNHFFENQ